MNGIILNEMDYQRLHSLVQMQRTANSAQAVALLSSKLKSATVLPSTEIPQDIVTMNSQVRLKDLKSGVEMEISIVYPKDADLANRKISVLAQLGTATLGLKTGEVVEWSGPRGAVSYKVGQILYQPEAAGDVYL